MHGFTGDIRAASRGLARARAFTAAAVATLAVAIAVNTALFSFVNAVFFDALPWRDAHRLHEVRVEPTTEGTWEAPQLREFHERLDGLAAIGAYREGEMVVAGDAGTVAQTAIGTRVETTVLSLLGVQPVAGRLFEDRDGVPGAQPVAVLDEDMAIARFGTAAAAIAGIVRIDGVDRTVVGVLPRGHAFPDFARLWLPLEVAADVRLEAGLRLVSRIPAELSGDAVAARLAALSSGGPARVTVRPLAPQAQAEVVALLGAIAFLFLIACVNVANLVLARGTARMHELGVRTALGASRRRLLRLLLAEGGVLATAAALLGGIIGVWLTDAIVGLIPADQLPLWFSAEVDVRVLAWIAGAATLATLVVSGLPAFVLTRGRLSSVLGMAGPRGTDARGGRLRAGLVAMQLALACTLLAGAGLLVRSFVEMRRADPGYAAARVLQIETRRAHASAGDDFVPDALQQLAGLPGVDGVAARASVEAPARVSAGTGTSAAATVEAVTPSFFEVMGLSIARGRTFAPGEVQSARFALVSASLADVLFGGSDAAIGREITLRPGDAVTVIGVTGDRRDWFAGGLEGTRPARHLYLTMVRADPSRTELLLRATGVDPRALAAPAAGALVSRAPDAVIGRPRTLEAVERERATDLRVFATLFAGFGALALALAAFGIYGVVAYSVSRRTREIGVRVAVGATARHVAALVARGILPAVAAGLSLGLAGSLALGRILRGALFGISAVEPALLGIILAAFVGITGVAAWLPARRAARVDPLSALRAE